MCEALAIDNTEHRLHMMGTPLRSVPAGEAYVGWAGLVAKELR